MSDQSYELKAKEPKKRNLGLILLIVLALIVSVFGLTKSLTIPNIFGSPTQASPSATLSTGEADFSTPLPAEALQASSEQIVWIVKDGVLQAATWEYIDPANPPSTEGYLQTEIVCETGSFMYPIPAAKSVLMLKPVTSSSTLLNIAPGAVNVLSCTLGDAFNFYAAQ